MPPQPLRPPPPLVADEGRRNGASGQGRQEAAADGMHQLVLVYAARDGLVPPLTAYSDVETYIRQLRDEPMVLPPALHNHVFDTERHIKGLGNHIHQLKRKHEIQVDRLHNAIVDAQLEAKTLRDGPTVVLDIAACRQHLFQALLTRYQPALQRRPNPNYF